MVKIAKTSEQAGEMVKRENVLKVVYNVEICSQK